MSVFSNLLYIHGILPLIKGSMLSLVYFKSNSSILPIIHSSTLPAGLFGVYYNKGAIALSIQLDSLLFSIVNCHLDAHQGLYYRSLRFHQINYILSTLYINSILLMDFNIVFLTGDLNSRLLGSWVDIKNMINNNDIDEMLLLDDINLMIRNEESLLYGYFEAKISFLPTYKMEGEEYSMKRVPAYCDRILYNNNMSVKCSNYSVLKNSFSDHDCVYGEYEITATSEITNHKKSYSPLAYYKNRLYYVFWINRLLISIGLLFWLISNSMYLL